MDILLCRGIGYRITIFSFTDRETEIVLETSSLIKIAREQQQQKKIAREQDWILCPDPVLF